MLIVFFFIWSILFVGPYGPYGILMKCAIMFIFLEQKVCSQIFNIISNSKICYILIKSRSNFDKILRSEYKIKKQNHFVGENFLILYGIFFSEYMCLFTHIFWSKIWNCRYLMKYGEFSKSVIKKMLSNLYFKSKLKTVFGISFQRMEYFYMYLTKIS